MISSVFFFKQKTAYEMRISDWSSDVCSSDLQPQVAERPSPRLPRHSPPRADLCHQQNQPPVQGPPGLNRIDWPIACGLSCSPHGPPPQWREGRCCIGGLIFAAERGGGGVRVTVG